MEKNYYLSLVASPEFTAKADRLLVMRAQGEPEPYVPAMLDLVDCFVPEVISGLMMGAAHAISLPERSIKILNSATGTIIKAINLLVSKLLKKRSNTELLPLVDYVEDIYLPAELCANGRYSIGCRIDAELRDELLFLVEQARAGKTEQYRSQIDDIWYRMVDAIIEGFMINALSRMEMKYVIRKISDASVATCRKTGSFVVTRVFRRITDQQFVDLGMFFVNQMQTVKR